MFVSDWSESFCNLLDAEFTNKKNWQWQQICLSDVMLFEIAQWLLVNCISAKSNMKLLKASVAFYWIYIYNIKL